MNDAGFQFQDLRENLQAEQELWAGAPGWQCWDLVIMGYNGAHQLSSLLLSPAELGQVTGTILCFAVYEAGQGTSSK